MKNKIGVLVMSYGTPESMEGIESYYTHIRRGNKPSEERLKELTDRYEAIVGGVFPLRENTDRQVRTPQDTLNADPRAIDLEFVCYQGLKHALHTSKMVLSKWCGTALRKRSALCWLLITPR